MNTKTKIVTKEDVNRNIVIALIMSAFLALIVCIPHIMPTVCAAGGIDNTPVQQVMDYFIEVLRTLCLYVGIAIALWAIINAILAYRREDSEGLISNVKLLVIGAVLVGIGAFLQTIYDALKNMG